MSNPALVAIIQDEIKQSGPIPFIRFMELALYHPGHGYYASPRKKIGGPGSDFYTSPSVHPIFAKLLAKQLIQMTEGMAISPEDPITFIEFGAGDGALCFQILQFIEHDHPTLFHRLGYIIVEKSRSFQLHQKERLLPRYAMTVQWEDKMPSPCVGIVFSNELLDAFPVHRMRIEINPPVGAGLKPTPTLKEIYLDWKDGNFLELLHPPSSPLLLSYFDRMNIKRDTAFDCEINLLALDWIRQVGQSLTKGFVLTLDYGYPAQQLYGRAKGTFLCYHQHTVNENPYDHIGEQDMTSHIDFTALAQAGKASGLSPLGFTDQTHFLMGLGIADEMQIEADKMDQSEEARRNFLAMRQLMDPARMGKTFKILVQGKGVASMGLNGLIFPAFPKESLDASSEPQISH